MLLEKNIIKKQEKINQLAEILKAIGNSSRLKILCILFQEEKCMSDILNHLDISQPALSQNLKLLTSKNLLGFRKEGTKIIYFIKNKELSLILNNICDLYIKE